MHRYHTRYKNKICHLNYDSDSNASTGTCTSTGTNTCIPQQKQKKILSKHIRKEGGDDLHVCKICSSGFLISVGSCYQKNVLRCPFCSDIFHRNCIQQFMRKSEYVVSCPNCRYELDYSLETWEISEDWYDDFFFSDDEEYTPKHTKIRKTNRILRNRIVFAE